MNQVPRLLAKGLKKALSEIRTVEVAYVAGLKWRQEDRPDSVLIALGGRTDRADQEVRATATALHRTFEKLDRPVDMIHFDSSEAKPGFIRRLGLAPVYRRRHN